MREAGPDRRRVTMGLAALALAGLAGPARAGTNSVPTFASPCFDRDGAALALFDGRGETSAAALPERGHGVASAPDGRSVVVTARRPGRWAVVFALPDLRPLHRLDLPAGRHFYGHGCFSPDGRRFFTTENDVDGGDGIIGVWDVERGFARIAERRSGGVGPHDLAITPDSRRLVVANGGIRTHPETGRDILNRDTMHPNLALLALDGDDVLATADLGPDLHLSSIRHLAVAPDGEVVFGCQFEGDKDVMPPLVGAWRTDRPGRAPTLWEMPEAGLARLDDYVGSVALDAAGRIVVATSPRGGAAALFERSSGRFLGLAALPDVCGVAASGEGFVVSSGVAGARSLEGLPAHPSLADPFPASTKRSWDNHMIALPPIGATASLR